MHDFQFYVKPENVRGEKLFLVGDEFHHCCRTLRFGLNDIVKVFDGNGNLFQVRIAKVDKHSAECEIIERINTPRHPALPVTLGIGITKSQALDEIIEVAQVMGIKELVPLATQFSRKGEFNLERFQRVAIAAAKQCGRTKLMEILQPCSLEQFIDRVRNCELKIVADQSGTIPIEELIFSGVKYSSVAVVVGPEGGLSSQEIEKAELADFKVVNLSEVRLRSELAVSMLIFYLNLLVKKGG